VQGDEPLIDPQMIDYMATNIIEQSGLKIATLIHRIDDTSDLSNPNVVKVVVNRMGEAMYFSRQAIPFVRDVPVEHWLDHGPFFKHIGMYAYTSQALLTIEKLNLHPYEGMEKLEQLTWLANGLTIQCHETNLESKGIDTDDDLKAVTAMIAEME
jgi:3-deoxy-manno-octulosonate cytidylyltransferase (CMP-KDO synthetase)